MQWQFIVTVSITILGWIAVHFLSERRDRKKEWRDFSRSTAVLVDEIEKDAIAYHTNHIRDKIMEVKIKVSINKLDTQIQLIRKNLQCDCDTSFFRAAITLDNFETQLFVGMETSSKITQDISWHAIQLKDFLFSAE